MDAYLYQYAVGGVVFLVGLAYAWRQGFVGLRGRALLNLLVAVGGLAAFAALQGWLQYAPMKTLPAVPYSGAPRPARVMGKPVDYAIMVGYFVVILVIGTMFSRRQKTTKDFFFGGQRFSWWLIALSLIATTVGSYSFVKYSRIAFTYGVASSQTYLNDWFWVPALLFTWLPLLYFSRVVSIPEYFERRFDRGARRMVTWLLLIYLVGYVGVNLFTMGTALHILLGWGIWPSAILVATISAIYVTAGGQTSVIMTDLFQGLMLLATGLVLVYLGAEHLGGLETLWENLPRAHRTAFANFASDPAYNSVGIFWQDAMANTAVFYFLNQGVMMRFMSARSVGEGKKAALTTMAVLMPIAAVVVASGGWVGRALSHAGELPPDMAPGRAFFITAELLSHPGTFGLIMAALTAALMSTVDTLITAIAAIAVNDVYQPRHPDASQAQLLRVARFSSVGVTLVGVALVPVFMMFDSIYAAHGAFTAAITPPMIVALLLGVFWRRFTPKAAFWTMAGGALAIVASILWPALVEPFAHGVPAAPVGDGLLAGARQYKYTRALYGLVVSGGIGVLVTFVTRPLPLERIRGLVWGTVADALARYKGQALAQSTPRVEAPGAGSLAEGHWVRATPTRGDDDTRHGVAGLPGITLTPALAAAVGVGPGDLVYVSDTRRWLGGLRSTHALVAGVDAPASPAGAASLTLSPSAYEAVVSPRRAARPVRLKRLY